MVTGPTDQKPRRVFLSYGRRDATAIATRLKDDLERTGYEVWVDTAKIRAGRSWEDQIVSAIRDSDVVVALLSPQSVRVASDPGTGSLDESPCIDELSFARWGPHPRPIVPVMAIDCIPPFNIFRLDYVDLRNWDNQDLYAYGKQRLMDGIDGAVNGESRYRTFDSWLNSFDFEAFIFQKSRNFVGRDWLFRAVDEWSTKPNERALLITGDPGIGKSAFLAEFARSNRDGSVLAHHFCQAGVNETLRPSTFIRSIAAMMAARLPELALEIERVEIRRALEAMVFDDPRSALEIGVLQPLNRVEPPSSTQYIIVDAMDEALATSSEDETIVQLLAWETLERLPAWLRLIATSRRDREVLKRLGGLRAFQLDASGRDNTADLTSHVVAQIRERGLEAAAAATGSGLSAADSLVRHAQGNFLYAELVLAAIERGQQDWSYLDQMPLTLRGAYERDFGRTFGNPTDWEDSKLLLELMVAASEPVPRGILVDASPGAGQALQLLKPYLREQYGTLTLFHQSVADWLRSDDHEWSVSPMAGLERLTELGLQALAGDTAEHLPAFWRGTLERSLGALGRWNTLSDLLTNEGTFARLYPVTYDYSHSWEALVEPWPHLLRLRESMPPEQAERLTMTYAQAFGTRARSILKRCSWAAERQSVESAKAREDGSFETVRDQLYSFVFMAAQAIQLHKKFGQNAGSGLEAMKRDYGDVLSFLHYLAVAPLSGISGKLSDQADYAWSGLND